jgi:hypothetical protein
MRISMRARGAPRQWCTPWPKATWGGPSRVMSKRPRSSTTAGSLAAGTLNTTARRAGSSRPRSRRRAAPDAGGAADDREPAHQLLDRARHRLGVVAHDGELLGVAQQGQGAEAEHVRRGLLPGHEQQIGDPDELVVRQVVVVLADEHADEVLAGLAPRPHHEVLHGGERRGRERGAPVLGW